MLWTDTSDINSLIVTLSLSPSMMLLGVRSRWMIRFSLCKYLKARQICGGFSMNLFDFYSYFPCSVQVSSSSPVWKCSRLSPRWTSAVSLWESWNVQPEELLLWAPSRWRAYQLRQRQKKTVFNHLFLYGVKMYENTMKICFFMNYASKKSWNII